MKSFFSRIQKKLSATYGGRYVEYILDEISREDSSIANILFDVADKEGYFQIEYKYGPKRRLADLAWFSKDTDELIGLVEIKYEDHKLPTNAGKLKDYIDYCTKKNIIFVYLTQHYPPTEDIAYVDRYGFNHILFSDLAEKIQRYKCSPLVSLFVNFLYDKGLIMNVLDENNIKKILVRIFLPNKKPTNQGNKNIKHDRRRIQGNLFMLEGFGDTWTGIMTNLSIIATEIQKNIDNKRKPSLDFLIWPEYMLPKKLFKQIRENDFFVSQDELQRYGGCLYMFARTALSGNANDFLYLEYGFCFAINNRKSRYTTSVYAHLFGKQMEEEKEHFKKIGNSIISDKSRCVKYIKDSIDEIKQNIKADKKLHSNVKNIFLNKVNIK